MKKIINFFKECYSELKKVVWPTRESVMENTKIVIISIAIVAVFLFCVDFLSSKLVADVLAGKWLTGGM